MGQVGPNARTMPPVPRTDSFTNDVEPRWNLAHERQRDIESRIAQHCGALSSEPAHTLKSWQRLQIGSKRSGSKMITMAAYASASCVRSYKRASSMSMRISLQDSAALFVVSISRKYGGGHVQKLELLLNSRRACVRGGRAALRDGKHLKPGKCSRRRTKRSPADAGAAIGC